MNFSFKSKAAFLSVFGVLVLGVIAYAFWRNNISETEIVGQLGEKLEYTVPGTSVSLRVNVPVSYGFSMRTYPEGPDTQRSVLGGVGFVPVLSEDVDRPLMLAVSVVRFDGAGDLRDLLVSNALQPAFGVQDTSLGSYGVYGGQEYFVAEEIVSPQKSLLRAVTKRGNEIVIVAMEANNAPG